MPKKRGSPESVGVDRALAIPFFRELCRYAVPSMGARHLNRKKWRPHSEQR